MLVRKFDVKGIANTDDIKTIRGAVEAIDGVHAVRVDNIANTVTVEFESKVREEDITKAINSSMRFR